MTFQGLGSAVCLISIIGATHYIGVRRDVPSRGSYFQSMFWNGVCFITKIWEWNQNYSSVKSSYLSGKGWVTPKIEYSSD